VELAGMCIGELTRKVHHLLVLMLTEAVALALRFPLVVTISSGADHGRNN